MHQARLLIEYSKLGGNEGRLTKETQQYSTGLADVFSKKKRHVPKVSV